MKPYLSRYVPYALFGLAVLGVTVSSVHLRVLRTQAITEWENRLTDESIELQIREQVADFDRQVRAGHVKVLELADRLAAVEVACRDLDRQRAAARQRCEQARRLLEKGMPTYEIAGRPYSRDQVEEEADEQEARTGQLESRLLARKELAAHLRKILAESRAQVAEARRLRDKVLDEVEVTRARLTGARLRQALMELSTTLRDPAATPSNFARQLAVFRERALQVEREAEAAGGETGPVRWEIGSTKARPVQAGAGQAER
jgi:hypothetical protein